MLYPTANSTEAWVIDAVNRIALNEEQQGMLPIDEIRTDTQAATQVEAQPEAQDDTQGETESDAVQEVQ
jgi:hypothetical protein